MKAAATKRKKYKQKSRVTTGIKTPNMEGVTAFEYLCIRHFFDNSFNKTQAYRIASGQTENRTPDEKGLRQNAWNLFNRPRVKEFITKRVATLDITKGTLAARLESLYEQDISEAIVFRPQNVNENTEPNAAPKYREIGKDADGNILYAETFDVSLTRLKELGLFHLVKKLKVGIGGDTEIEFHQQKKKEVLDSMAKLQGYVNETILPDDTTETPLARFTRMLEESIKNGTVRATK